MTIVALARVFPSWLIFFFNRCVGFGAERRHLPSCTLGRCTEPWRRALVPLGNTKPFSHARQECLARDKQTPLNSGGDGAEGHAGSSGRVLFRRSFAQPKWKRVIKAALLRAGRAASPPPSQQQPGPAPALLPGCKCHARQFISVGLLRLLSVEQREGSCPGIGLNEGNLYVFIL